MRRRPALPPSRVPVALGDGRSRARRAPPASRRPRHRRRLGQSSGRRDQSRQRLSGDAGLHDRPAAAESGARCRRLGAPLIVIAPGKPPPLCPRRRTSSRRTSPALDILLPRTSRPARRSASRTRPRPFSRTPQA